MADLAQAESAFMKADAAGDTEAARVLAGEVRRLRGESKTSQIPGGRAQPKVDEGWQGVGEELKGAGETALTLGTGVLGLVPAAAAAAIAGVRGQDIPARFKEFSENTTYSPRTVAGQRDVWAIGHALDVSKVAGLNPAIATEAGILGGPASRVAATAVRDSAVDAAGGVRNVATGANGRIRALLGASGQPEAMPGIGAADTAAETIRRERAANLPVPIKLTKGDASRDVEQQRFEKETMKSDLGGPLRERAADNVGAVIKNFEAWVDETGAQAPDLIGTGKSVDRALVKRMESAKAEIRNAYTKAETAGEMAQPVSTQPLAQFINENRSAMKLAPVVKAAEDEMIRLGGASKNADGILFPGEMPLNDVEKMRKLIVRLSRADETNGHFGSEANKVIDAMTEGQGGDLYKKARGMFKEYAAEFKGQGAVRKLVSTKANSVDRAVALEDVFNHSVLSGSNQDTANIIRSLEKAGPEGLQGINELKGATINYLLGRTTENAGRDIRGQPIPSFSKLDKAVRALDADGKLDMLFGKAGAAKIRDLKELVADISTASPGVINTSNTAAVLKEAFTAAATGRLPTATAKAIAGIKSAVGDRATMKKVRDALVDPAELGAGGNTVH